MKQSNLCILFTLLFGMASLNLSFAQTVEMEDVPRTISYQGIVSPITGGQLPTGEYAVTVRLYADESGENVVWKGEYTTRVVDGLLNLELGSGAYPLPGPTAMDRALWIGVQMGDNPEMTPRTRMSAVPYALTIPDQSVTADKLAVNYVSSIQVDGQEVTTKGSSFNLVGGSGIDLRYDPITQAMQIDLSQEARGTQGDEEKGGSVQAANSAVYWSETGNNSTTPGTNYVGTSDNKELEIHVYDTDPTANQGSKRVMLFDPQGSSANIIGGYQGNLPGRGSAIEGATISGGGQNNNINNVQDDYGTIGGGDNNVAGGLQAPGTTDDAYATVGGGQSNQAQANHSTVGGGQSNQSQANHSTVGGGQSNLSQANHAAITGGQGNTAQATWSAIGGGQRNNVLDPWGTIGGGLDNQTGNVQGMPMFNATVGGGWFNTAFGSESTIAGGEDNVTATAQSTIGGGFQNLVYSDYGFIGGGQNNSIGELPAPGPTIPPNRPIAVPMAPATSQFATIGGGNTNVIGGGFFFPGMFGTNSTIGGGATNMANDINATIGGGNTNMINAGGGAATIGGGITNTINAADATIGGGNTNTINAATGTVGGGTANVINGTFAAIGGGEQNQIDGTSSAIPGGRYLRLGANSFGFNGDNTIGGPTQTDLSAQNDLAYFGNVNLWLGNVDGNPRELQLYAANTSFTYAGAAYTGFKAPPVLSHAPGVYVLPPNLPAASPAVSILTGNSAQTLSWTAVLPVANGGTGTSVTPTNNGVAYGSGGVFAFTAAGTSGQVLTANASGVPVWTTPAPLGWALTGNSGTVAGTNYVGTSDAVDLVIATNGIEAIRVGNASPAAGGVTVANGLTVSAGGAAVTGSSSVTGTLDLAGANSALLSNGNAGVSGEVLTSQGPGTTPVWQAAPSAGWALTGNSGTTPGTDYLGTSDSKALVIATNGTERMRVETDGMVGVGTNSPDVSMDVNGAIAVRPPTATSVTADNTTVTVGNNSYLRISADGTPANRTIILSSGLEGGQILVIHCTAAGSNGIEMLKSQAVHAIASDYSMNTNDNITLIWDAVAGCWLELSRTNL